MQIQRGDQRQYFSKEVQQNYIGEIARSLNDTFQTGMNIAQKAQLSDLANKQQQYANQVYLKNNEINTKWQADPTNPEVEKERKEAFKEIADSFEINPISQ